MVWDFDGVRARVRGFRHFGAGGRFRARIRDDPQSRESLEGSRRTVETVADRRGGDSIAVRGAATLNQGEPGNRYERDRRVAIFFDFRRGPKTKWPKSGEKMSVCEIRKSTTGNN